MTATAKLVCVIAGEPHRIVIPVTSDYMAGPGRLKGLRCVHTHLADEAPDPGRFNRPCPSETGLYDSPVHDSPRGIRALSYSAHILPDPESDPYQVLAGTTQDDLDADCQARILELESELSRLNRQHRPETGRENAFLINATTGDPKDAYISMDELRELCKTSHIKVIGYCGSAAQENRSQVCGGQG